VFALNNLLAASLLLLVGMWFETPETRGRFRTARDVLRQHRVAKVGLLSSFRCTHEFPGLAPGEPSVSIPGGPRWLEDGLESGMISSGESFHVISTPIDAHTVPAQNHTFGTLKTAHQALQVAAFVAGLALSNQHTIALFLLPVGVGALWRRRAYLSTRLLLACVGCGLLGLLPYVYLPLASRPPTQYAWGDTSSLSGLLSHFLRREYGSFQMTGAFRVANGSQRINVLVHPPSAPVDCRAPSSSNWAGLQPADAMMVLRRDGRGAAAAAGVARMQDERTRIVQLALRVRMYLADVATTQAPFLVLPVGSIFGWCASHLLDSRSESLWAREKKLLAMLCELRSSSPFAVRRPVV
jgi:hypothetical protein